MHTATRLAGPAIAAARRVNPRARIAAFGLYAPLNAEWLRSLGVDRVLGGEFEEELVAWANDDVFPQSTPRAQSQNLSAISAPSAGPVRDALPRIHFLVPDRSGLPALSIGRHPADAERRAASGRLHGSEPRLQTRLPALPGGADLQRAVSCRVAGRRARRRRRAGGGRRGAHHVRRPGLLQRSHARDAHRGRAARRASRRQLRRDDQGRAPAAPPRPGAAAGRDRLRVRDERRGVDRRRGADDLRQRTHAGRFRGGGRTLPRGRRHADADVRGVPPVADARVAIASSSTRSPRSISSITSPRFSSRSGCSCPKARVC